jgi:hypothetical protein
VLCTKGHEIVAHWLLDISEGAISQIDLEEALQAVIINNHDRTVEWIHRVK